MVTRETNGPLTLASQEGLRQSLLSSRELNENTRRCIVYWDHALITHGRNVFRCTLLRLVCTIHLPPFLSRDVLVEFGSLNGSSAFCDHAAQSNTKIDSSKAASVRDENLNSSTNKTSLFTIYLGEVGVVVVQELLGHVPGVALDNVGT